MPGRFPILQLRSDSPDVVEQLGSKEKFWFRMPDDEQPWLFKFTRENTGEDWSEKIASEVAVLLQVPAAKVELAEFMGKRGCASRSFVQTKKGFDLIHGGEVLAGRVLGYEKLKPEDFNGIVAMVPIEWMGVEAKQFCLKLMSVTVERLKAVQL